MTRRFSEIRRTPQYRQLMFRWRLAEFLTGWMRRLPLGDLAQCFWGGLIEEGVVQTLKPRWGRLTFAYLNDGVKPTLWHTWHNVTHQTHYPDDCPGCYMWPSGAPRNAAEAFRTDKAGAA